MPEIPYGFCQCGCGEKTKIALRTDTAKGWIKGRPMRFVAPHHSRWKSPVAFVEKDFGYETPCWVWQRRLSTQGYGRTYADGREKQAHQVTWERVYGPVPEGLELDHLCRVRSCVNPAHLEAVPHPVNVQRGAVGRITAGQAREIRSRRLAGERTMALAEEFGISQRHVYMVASGECWPNVTGSARL